MLISAVPYDSIFLCVSLAADTLWCKCRPSYHRGNLPDSTVCPLHLRNLWREAQWAHGFCGTGCGILAHPWTPPWGNDSSVQETEGSSLFGKKQYKTLVIPTYWPSGTILAVVLGLAVCNSVLCASNTNLLFYITGILNLKAVAPIGGSQRGPYLFYISESWLVNWGALFWRRVMGSMEILFLGDTWHFPY